MGDRFIIERRGGIAGLTARGSVDADAMHPDDRRRLDQILDGDRSPADAPGADRYTYLVTRESAAGCTTCEIPESVMPAAVARLVAVDI